MSRTIRVDGKQHLRLDRRYRRRRSGLEGTAVAVAFARNPMTAATIANNLQARIAPVGASMISSSLQSASTSPRATLE